VYLELPVRVQFIELVLYFRGELGKIQRNTAAMKFLGPNLNIRLP
jgi:hypothetical protein